MLSMPMKLWGSLICCTSLTFCVPAKADENPALTGEYYFNCSAAYLLLHHIYKARNEPDESEKAMAKSRALEIKAYEYYDTIGITKADADNFMQHTVEIFVSLATDKPSSFLASKQLCDKRFP